MVQVELDPWPAAVTPKERRVRPFVGHIRGLDNQKRRFHKGMTDLPTYPTVFAKNATDYRASSSVFLLSLFR